MPPCSCSPAFRGGAALSSLFSSPKLKSCALIGLFSDLENGRLATKLFALAGAANVAKIKKVRRKSEKILNLKVLFCTPSVNYISFSIYA